MCTSVWLLSATNSSLHTRRFLYTDRFERALESARETLKRARSRFHGAAISKEQKDLFGHRGKTVRATKGKKQWPVPWPKQFVCLAYFDQAKVPLSDEEIDELYHSGLGMKTDGRQTYWSFQNPAMVT